MIAATRSRMVFGVLVPAILTSFCSMVLAGPSMPTAEQIEELNSLEGSFQTPHTKWAKPYAGGKVRVLFLAQQQPDVNVLPLRHAVELMQRFDLSGDAVLVMKGKGSAYATTYAGGSGVFGAALGEQRLARLLENEYDTFVITGEVMGHLPEAARTTILEKVRGGAGLALLRHVGEQDAPLIAGAEKLDELPQMLAGIDAEAWRLGLGRLVAYAPPVWRIYLRMPSEVYGLGHIFGTDLLRDLRFEKQGRAILWAAGRAPRLRLSVSLAKSQLDRSKLATQNITVRWQGVAGIGLLRLSARIRSQSRGGRRLPPMQNLSAASGTHDFRLPQLPAGRYSFDVSARSERGVEAWAVEPFSVTSSDRIGAVRIDETWSESGAPITGTVTVEATGGANRTLRVHLVDRYGRVVARQELSDPGAEARFSLPTRSWMPNYLGVEAALVIAGREVSYGYAPDPCTIPIRRHDRWNFILWGRLYSGEFDDIAEEFLSVSGVTSRLETSHVPWWYMSRVGMNYVPYCSSGLYRLPDSGRPEAAVDADGVLSGGQGCWNDEPVVSARLKQYLDDEMDYRRHGVLTYSMGDEMAVHGSCLHPACWKVYQQWLKDQYGTIEAINRSWGSKLERFDQVQPLVDNTNLSWLPAKDKKSLLLTAANNEHGSKGLTHGSTAWTRASKNYPRYIDRRSFQYWNFANYARRFGEAARRIDPQAKWGVEGNDTHLDADIDVIVRHTGWWMPYGEHGGTANEVIRSIAPRGYLQGNFVGRSFFWESVLRGANAVGRWRVDNFLTPQMALKRSIRRRVESAGIITDGLGTLLNVHGRTGMLHDGIVMLHSMTSVEMAKIATSHNDREAGPTYGHFRERDANGRNHEPDERRKRSHLSWHRAIRACGLQFMYTTDGQIRRGEFDPAPYKVMILSQYEAIGPEEEALIRDFAARGGTVIADVRPGLYGARGRQVRRPVLDDLFGVRHMSSTPAVKTQAEISGRIAGKTVDAKLVDLYVNPAVEVVAGKALGMAGDTPIYIVNDVGDGRAILLNFTMWSYPNLSIHDGPQDAGELFRDIFASADVEWPLELLDEDRRRHRNIEAMRWRTGADVEVVALYGPARGTWADGPLVAPAPFDGLDRAAEVTVRLHRPRHVSEMRTGRRSGPTREFITGVRPWWATFLVLSERELRSPRLKTTSDSIARGSIFELIVNIPDTRAVHALKVRAVGPDGRDAPWFSQTVFVEDGTATIGLPIAHNEQPGEWTVTATDLYTEQTGKHSFIIK